MIYDWDAEPDMDGTDWEWLLSLSMEELELWGLTGYVESPDEVDVSMARTLVEIHRLPEIVV
jgi:hypothetical protein